MVSAVVTVRLIKKDQTSLCKPGISFSWEISLIKNRNSSCRVQTLMIAKKLPWNTLAKLLQWCPSLHGKSLLFCESLPASRKRNSVEFEWKGYNRINTFSHIYFKTVYEEAGKRLNCCFSKKWCSLSLNFIFDKLCYFIGCIFLNWWYFHMVDNGRYFLFWCWKSDQEIGKKMILW